MSDDLEQRKRRLAAWLERNPHRAAQVARTVLLTHVLQSEVSKMPIADRELAELTAAEAELRDKLKPIATGLREALERFDAGGGMHHPTGCACEMCAAIAELRRVAAGVATGLAALEAITPEPTCGICFRTHTECTCVANGYR